MNPLSAVQSRYTNFEKRGKIVFQYLVCKKAVAAFGRIASECIGVCHLVNRRVHGFYALKGQGTRDIAYAEVDYIGFGVSRSVFAYLAAH